MTAEAIRNIGTSLHGPGFGPTLGQYLAHHPPGALTGFTLYAAVLGDRPDLPPRAQLRKAQWLEILKALNLAYPPRKQQRPRRAFNDDSFTGDDVEFLYGRAVDSVLHVGKFRDRRIWWHRGRRWVDVEVARVISGERLQPVVA